MRLTLYLAAIVTVSSAPASGQTEDTTSAWRYFPLEIGNVWEYEDFQKDCYPDGGCEGPRLIDVERWQVTGEEVFDDVSYYEINIDTAAPGRSQRTEWASSPDQAGASTYFVRFDTLSARLVTPEGEAVWWSLTCSLGAAFGGEGSCSGRSYTVAGDYDQEVPVDDDVVVATRKDFNRVTSADASTFSFASDLGFFYERYYLDEIDLAYTEWNRFLRYAKIDGTEHGTSRFPVASEETTVSTSNIAVSAYPNPTRGATTLTIALDRPQRASLAVYDVLGRRVLAEDLGALPSGEQRHRLDMSALPPGLYVVRLTGKVGATATTRLIRQ